MALGRVITSGVTLTNPLPGTPIQGGTPYTKDTFSVASLASLIGRNTNNDPGLTVQAWQGTADCLAINNGKVVRGTSTASTWSAQVNILSTAGAYVYMTVSKLPSTVGLYLDLFRNLVGGAPDGYRAEFTASGTVRLLHRLSGASVYYGSPQPVSPGDRVGVRWLNGNLSLVINEVPVITTAVNVVTRTGYAGLSGLTATTGFEIDDLTACLY